MSENTVTTPSTTGPTPCPSWCNGVHFTRATWEDDFHVCDLAAAAGPGGVNHDVRLIRSTNPDAPDDRIEVTIRGNGIDTCGSEQYPMTQAELLDLAAMFETAANALRASTRA